MTSARTSAGPGPSAPLKRYLMTNALLAVTATAAVRAHLFFSFRSHTEAGGGEGPLRCIGKLCQWS